MMIIRLILPAVVVLTLVSCETNEPAVKRNYISSYKGMAQDKGSVLNKALVKQADPASMKKYTKVLIEDVKVIPSKNVPAKQKRATQEEGERLAEHFEITLAKELGAHYEVTNRRGRDTLLVRAALTDLQPSKPGVFVFNYLPYAAAVTTGLTFATGSTPGAGSTSMEAEVLDSMTRRQLYAIVDQLKGSKFQPGGIEKWGQTEGAMRGWSRKIRVGIQGDATTADAGPTPAAKRYFKNQDETKTAPKPVAKTATPAVKPAKTASNNNGNGPRMIVRADRSEGIQRVKRGSTSL